MDKININAVDATQSREGAVEALLGVDINGEVRRTNITKLDTYSKSEIDSKDGAIKQYTDLQISALIGGATPASLDTISKLAAALQEDDNAFSAINKGLSTKYGPDNKPTAAALDVLPRVNPIANGTMTAERYVTTGGSTIYNQQGTTTWVTNKAISDPTHKGIGVSDTEPKFWDGTTSKPIWHDGNAPVYAKRWPTLVEIKAQAAGSYAAASHTHPWTQITGVPAQATRWPTASEAGAAAASHTHPWAQVTGVPVQATRWPNKAEVGLSNVGNFTSAKDVTVNTNALRDENGDLVARQFHGTHVGDGSNLTNLPWAQVTGVPVQATRWPTLAEIKAQAAGSYAAASHTHAWSQVTGQPATATRWPTFAEVTAAPATATRWPTFAEVSGKPATYPATAHTHPVSQITGLGTAATTAATDYAKSQGRVVNNGNLFLDSGMYGINGSPPNTVSGYGAMIVARNSDTGLQISGGHNTDNLHFRGFSGSGSQFTPWRQVYHTGNMPATATRWPTFGEVSGKPTNYATTWASVAAKPATATRWPTLVEIGAQAAGSYANAAHTHTWAQISGIPAYATRWPSPAEIGAQAAGSYAAASHTHPWANITGAPAQATRWPNKAEVGLGNVGNYTSSAGVAANTNALRDGNGDLVARQLHGAHVGDGSNLTNLQWARLIGAPAQATRWPTPAEAGATAAPYTGTDSDLTNYPLGAYLFVSGYKQSSTARNQRKTLYISVSGGYGKDVVTSNAGAASNADWRALSGAWAARGVSAANGGNDFGWHHVVLFQRVA